MCVFGKPDTPEPVAIQQPARQADPAVQDAAANSRKRLRAASGSQSTLLTQDTALSAPLVGKTALGA